VTRDVRLLFTARSVRLFGYGGLVVVLVLYLARVGLNGAEIGLLLSLTLIGDTLVSLFLTTRADRLGRRRVLVFGGILMGLSGVVFAGSDAFLVMLVAATLGVISPTGQEVGPFHPIEQAALSEIVHDHRWTRLFGWYNVVGSLATAAGSLVAGIAAGLIRDAGMDDLAAYRVILAGYAAVGFLLAAIFWTVSPAVESPRPSARGSNPDDARPRTRFGLHRSKGIVARIAGLYSIDSFASGLVSTSLVTYWLYQRFGVDESFLGVLLFVSNLLNAGSALASASIARRVGLINTMVFSHIPASIFLALIPFSPSIGVAVVIVLLRAALSQMDLPARQSYTMAMVDSDERSAAAGIIGVARTTGQTPAPGISAPLIVVPGLAYIPFVLAGGLKVASDVALWFMFRSRPAPHEQVGRRESPEGEGASRA
jgi:MFS family permease